jgi:hypothetical protein
MVVMEATQELETQIAQWCRYLRRHHTISAADVDEMEDHLREQVADLTEAGLSEDEAFLIAVKRMGSTDAISREFAREHSDRLWKQLVLVPGDEPAGEGRSRLELAIVIGLGVAAGVAVKIGDTVFGQERFGLNIGVLVLPFLAGYFVWKRRVALPTVLAMAGAFVAAALVLNLYPFDLDGDTVVLATIHAPIALAFAVGLAYVGGEWRSHVRRMDFIRFTGEWIVYYTLLALGGGVLIGLTVAGFEMLDLRADSFIENWVLMFGAPGAVLVAAWLVEAKQNVVENIAPVLTRVFTPLTVLMLWALLAAIASTRSITDADRELLILMDLILVLVLGLLLYAMSARDPHRPPEFFDRLQLALVVSALAVNLVMLTAMLTRIAEFGSSPNKIAALGMNVLLLINLAWSTWLTTGFLRRQRSYAAPERWQTGYLPVFGAWAALVVIALPPVFGFG